MEIIDAVLAHYIPTSTELIGGQPQRRTFSAGNDVGADYQIRKELPDILREEVTKSGRDVATFKVWPYFATTPFAMELGAGSIAFRRGTETVRATAFSPLGGREPTANGCWLRSITRRTKANATSFCRTRT